MRKRFMAYVPGSAPVVVADTTAPSVPANVVASSITSAGFVVSWDPSTDNVGVTGYTVQVGGTTYGTTTGATTLAVSGRAASTAYAVRVSASDAAGNTSALSTAITVTTTAVPTGAPVSLFSTQTPASTDLNDGQGITLSTRIVSDINGSISGVRFYRAATAPASVIGLVYSDAGVELARATFGTLTTGWNSVTFATPVAVAAGTFYRVAYWSSGPYALSSGFFTSSVTNGHLTGTGGYYGYGATPAAGISQFNGGAYFADVLFVADQATVPSTPAAPSISGGPASLFVNWTAPASNGGSAITGYDLQPFIGATGGTVTSVGVQLAATITGLTPGTAYTVKIRAKNAVGASAYSAASGTGTPSAASASNVTHGDQLTIAKVGPWALQGVARGSETMGQTLVKPSPRGYWRFDAPDEFSSTTAWPSNATDANPGVLNSPSLRGGVVTGSPVTIDGYTIPVGTRIVQFQELPDDTEFFAQGTSLKVLFRGCRFRWTTGMSGIGIFNDAQSTVDQQIMIHYCDIGLRSLDPPSGEGLMHVKFTAGRNHRLLRNYHTRSATYIQPNTTGVEITENYIDEYLYGYGPGGMTGVLPNPNAGHLNGISTEGGQTALKILRNRIVAPSPDGATGSTGSALGQIGFGTQPGQEGYGSGTEPGRIVSATDNIAIFTNGGDNPGDDTTGIQIRDNYVGGTAWCIYAGGTNATNVKLTGNKFTTRWWTNAGFFGPIATAPTWGVNGNVQSGNVWADDYGNGGDGNTAPANRQYPAGNGPRTGTAV